MALLRWGLHLVLTAMVAAGCNDDDDDKEWTVTGHSCDVADECYEDVIERDALPWEPVCMDRVEGGYCTHHCKISTNLCLSI